MPLRPASRIRGLFDIAAPNDHLPGINGLRALAALSVFAAHAQSWLFRGGWFGVDIFFVISGFVITRSLVREHEATGTIHLAGFYMRRAVRLMPALIAMVLAVWLWRPTAFVGQWEVLPALLYYANWTRAFTDFPRLLAHTWTLAVEEQFYLTWPLLLLALLSLRLNPLRAVLVLALASALWRAWLFTQGHGENELFNRFDTHCDALFIGTALALCSTEQLRQLARLFSLAAIFLIVCLRFSEWDQRWMYHGGFTLIALASAIVIARVVTMPASMPVRMLEWPPLRSLGIISYGFYLWHFPIINALPAMPLRTPTGFVLTLAAAMLSWYLIERPAKRLLPHWARLRVRPSAPSARHDAQPSLSPPSIGA